MASVGMLIYVVGRWPVLIRCLRCYVVTVVVVVTLNCRCRCCMHTFALLRWPGLAKLLRWPGLANFYVGCWYQALVGVT